MSQSASNKYAEHASPRDGESGPLQRRIVTGSQSLGESRVSERGAASSYATQYATIGMLDGTVVGRLECDESLGLAVLGRSSLSEIQIHDQFVHRAHAEIYWDQAIRAHVIVDGGGSNGTFVNLQRVDKPTRLADGTRIRVGKTELIYRRVYYPGG